ncbi:MAG: leucine-rich repeat domain-containing protein [Lachnospiraceae bacterium]|nr:leucine-rich repeat domain-containing protein [Lachnospiraceae bacterium]
MDQEERNSNEEAVEKEELDYQEYEGNRFLIYHGVLKDVELLCETVLLPESVREIRRQAFLNVRLQNRMETLVLPAAVKKIDRLSFAGMESLRCVEIASDSLLKVLEPGLFRNCTSLERAVLPASIRKIESRAFENCIRLKDVELASPYVIVREDAFLNCPCLKHKQIEAAVLRDTRQRKEEEERKRQAKYELFQGLGKKKSGQKKEKEVPVEPVAGQDRQEQVEELQKKSSWKPESRPQKETELNANTEFCIREGVLERCEIGCAHVMVPQGVKVIAPEAFSGSLKRELLECLEFPEGVEYIGERACYGMENLREIRFPASVSYIGKKTFEGTAWLSGERKKSSCVVVNGILISAYYDSMVLEANLPETIRRISSHAFYLSEVYRIKLPDSVQEIDTDAFYHAGVTEIEFPNRSGLILHAPVIKECDRLKELIIPEKIERLEAGMAENCPALQRICLKGAGTAVSKQAFPENVRIWVL